MTLKSKTYAAVRWTTVAAAVRALLQIVQVAVLSRLLIPEEYGLMAMVGVVLGFAGMFADLGVNSAFVQSQNVSEVQRSSLFWFNVAVSAALSLLVIAASPMFSWAFGDERLTPLVMLSASTFVINALGLQVRMSAEKDLDFRPVMFLEIGAALLGFSFALIAAFAGWGVYALVFGGIVSATTGTVLAWMFVARGWRPLLQFRLEDVRPYLNFGGAIVANNIVNQINMSIDLLMGGRLLGAAQLGIYSVPRNLVLQLQFMVNPIITRVGFPLIAQVQNDLLRVRGIYLKTLNMTSSINAPLYVGIAFFAPDIVAVLLGEGWQEAIPILRVTAVWGLFRSIGNPAGSLLFGMGRADLALKWNLGLLFVLSPVVWFGSHYGATGIAVALLGFAVAMFLPGWYVLIYPLCQVTFNEYAIAALRPLLLAVLGVSPAYLIITLFDGAIPHLIVAAAISTPLYFLLSYFLNREWSAAVIALLTPPKR